MSWKTPTKEQAYEASRKKFVVPTILKVIFACILVVPVATLAAAELTVRSGFNRSSGDDIASPNTKRLYAARTKEAWPLTIPYGDLHCEPLNGSPKLQIVTLVYGGTTYAVNGTAKGQAARHGWYEIDEVWKDNPELPGTKVSIGEILSTGRALCKP